MLEDRGKEESGDNDDGQSLGLARLIRTSSIRDFLFDSLYLGLSSFLLNSKSSTVIMIQSPLGL